jgi:hypothetical protein
MQKLYKNEKFWQNFKKLDFQKKWSVFKTDKQKKKKWNDIKKMSFEFMLLY